ncbi:MAG: hypothetical protein GKR87_10230 [Kiritimatiellae bacterium]|nr:hypothetical protein [Kiritimatiellia bacterium]NKB24648.1 hypothetical protein [Kiritimatiellia bacterium]NKB24730.1 hypothetical protein [Kiritimatiellia bacterium]
MPIRLFCYAPWWPSTYCAVRLVRHAGRIELHFGKRCRWFEVIQDIAPFLRIALRAPLTIL